MGSLVWLTSLDFTGLTELFNLTLLRVPGRSLTRCPEISAGQGLGTGPRKAQGRVRLKHPDPRVSIPEPWNSPGAIRSPSRRFFPKVLLKTFLQTLLRTFQPGFLRAFAQTFPRTFPRRGEVAPCIGWFPGSGWFELGT